MDINLNGSFKLPSPTITLVDFSGDSLSLSGQSLPNSTVIIEHGTFKYSAFTSTGFFNFTFDKNDKLSLGENIFTLYSSDQSSNYSDRSVIKATTNQEAYVITYDFSIFNNDIKFLLPKSSNSGIILLGGSGNDTYQINKSRVYDFTSLIITDTKGSNIIDVFEDLRSSTNIAISNARDEYDIDPDGSFIVRQFWTENGVSKSSLLKMPQALIFLRDHGIDDNYKNNGIDNFDVLFQFWKSSIAELAPNVGGTIGLGTQNADVMIGSALRNVIFSVDGNDVIKSGKRDDQIDGGNGIDRVLYSGSVREYSITDHLTKISDSDSNRDGSDTLTNIERIQFSDKLLALDIDGNAGQAYRLYQAALDRTPDERGLAGWIKFMDEGGALVNMAQQFIDSQEFRTKYGALDDRNFVNQLYLNVLDRNGEPAGIAGWVNGLANGLTRADVLKGFSESSENQANVIGQIKNGIPYVEWWLS
jgi:hypothetical protein